MHHPPPSLSHPRPHLEAVSVDAIADVEGTLAGASAAGGTGGRQAGAALLVTLVLALVAAIARIASVGFTEAVGAGVLPETMCERISR